MTEKLDLRSQTCCFSGHRTIHPDQIDIVKARAEILIRELILERNIKFFGVGGARGFDYLVSEILLRLRATDFPDIKVILIYPFENYQSKWTREHKNLYAQIWDKFDKRVCVSAAESTEAFLARNRHIVNHSSILIAYCNRSKSGTGYTVNYAMQQGVEVINLAL